MFQCNFYCAYSTHSILVTCKSQNLSLRSIVYDIIIIYDISTLRFRGNLPTLEMILNSMVDFSDV